MACRVIVVLWCRGGTFFFTVVTYRRRPLFADPWARRMHGSVIRRCLLGEPFTMDSIVLLEDHWHVIWMLPPGDTAYSKRWGWIKREFSRHWLAAGGREDLSSPPDRRRRPSRAPRQAGALLKMTGFPQSNLGGAT